MFLRLLPVDWRFRHSWIVDGQQYCQSGSPRFNVSGCQSRLLITLTIVGKFL